MHVKIHSFCAEMPETDRFRFQAISTAKSIQKERFLDTRDNIRKRGKNETKVCQLSTNCISLFVDEVIYLIYAMLVTFYCIRILHGIM